MTYTTRKCLFWSTLVTALGALFTNFTLMASDMSLPNVGLALLMTVYMVSPHYLLMMRYNGTTVERESKLLMSISGLLLLSSFALFAGIQMQIFGPFSTLVFAVWVPFGQLIALVVLQVVRYLFDFLPD